MKHTEIQLRRKLHQIIDQQFKSIIIGVIIGFTLGVLCW